MFVLPLTRTSHYPSAHRAAMSRLFDESLTRAFGGSATDTSARTPAMDVAETDNSYSVAFEVPGATREQLKVSVEGRRVSLTTVDAAAAEPKEGERALYRERGASRYARTVSLPAEVDQSTSQAKFENGVLTLTLAKKVPAGATQLSIN